MIVRPFDLDELATRVREAIREELRVSSRGLLFRAWEVHRNGGILHLSLEPDSKHSVLDESLEEGRISWDGDLTGSAEVISVFPSVSAATGFLTNGSPPRDGSVVYIKPPRYLEKLLELWGHPVLARKLANLVFEIGENRVTWAGEVPLERFASLRPAQRESFGLVGWATSFLWGPPGTGKTYTLGHILASYLVHHPTERALLLSSTNAAVDLAIVAVDDALSELNPSSRPICFRFGSRFDPKKFSDRKHLIPLRDKTLVEKLHRHYEVIPHPAEPEQYHLWKRHRDRLREAIRKENLEFLSRARLASMTTTLAAYDFSSLGRFDLVVFDEASQVGKAQAMTFAHLGKRSLYAGDPNQLAPIAQADTSDAAEWLAKSPFDWIDRSSLRQAVCMLNEQSRMAKPISAAVSSLFYESKLRVADTAENDPEWIVSRSVKATRLLRADNVVLVHARAAAITARQFRGYECPESAQLITALIADHAVNWSIADVKSDILVLTPYRAQRRKIEEELRSIQAPTIVSTVHRAQGSERRIVIFDPVCPSADFVSGKEGERLMNVAFSRAKCRLIVMLQHGWEGNRVLNQLSKWHRPVELDEAEVSRLLLTKLGLNKVVRPVFNSNPVIACKKTPPAQARGSLDDFREELGNRGAQGLPKDKVRQLARDVKDKARFRKVSWEEIELVVTEFSGAKQSGV